MVHPPGRAAIALAFLILTALPAHAQIEPVRGGPAVAGAVAGGADAVADGVKLGKAGKYEVALGRFEDAARRFPSATHECYVALANLRIGRLTHARLHIDVADERGDPVPAWCGRDLRKELNAQLGKRGFVPVAIKVEPPDSLIAAGDVLMIGGRTLWLPPGPIVVSAGHDDFGDAQVEARVPERAPAGGTTVTVTLEPIKAVPIEPVDVGPIEPTERTPPAEASTAPLRVDAPPPPGRPLAGWLLTAGGVAAAGVGVWFHVAASGTRADANALPASDPTFAALDRDFSRQRALAIGGYAVGAVALGVGSYLLLRPREGRRPASAGLQVGARGALVVLGWEL